MPILSHYLLLNGIFIVSIKMGVIAKRINSL